MALSSFIANCFKYLWVSKMKPICIPQIVYEDSEFINHYRQKTTFICFFLFETSKSWNCWPFYPTGTMSRTHTFEKRQCDRCRHRSVVKNTPPPSLSPPSPHPSPPPYPPPQRQLPRANDIGPFGSCDLLGQWRGIPGAKHRNPICSYIIILSICIRYQDVNWWSSKYWSYRCILFHIVIKKSFSHLLVYNLFSWLHMISGCKLLFVKIFILPLYIVSCSRNKLLNCRSAFQD